MKRNSQLCTYIRHARLLTLLAVGSVVACQSAWDPAGQVRDLAVSALEEIGARVITREERIRLQVEELGATTIIVKSVEPTRDGSSVNSGTPNGRYDLQRSDFSRIVSSVPTIQRAMPMRSAMVEARSAERNAQVRLVGCSDDYFNFNRLTIRRGRALTMLDVRANKKVVVLSESVARELLPDRDPIGAQIRMGGATFAVVGCAAQRDSISNAIRTISGLDAFSHDVYVPIAIFDLAATSRGDTGQGGPDSRATAELDRIFIVVDDVSSVDGTVDIIDNLLRLHHEQGGYSISAPLQWLREGEHLSGFEKCAIVGVDLSVLRVTDDALAAVSDLNDLEMLLLDKTSVGDQSLKHLSGLRHLKFLSLRKTRVTETGVADLRKSLPECAIVR